MTIVVRCAGTNACAAKHATICKHKQCHSTWLSEDWHSSSFAFFYCLCTLYRRFKLHNTTNMYKQVELTHEQLHKYIWGREKGDPRKKKKSPKMSLAAAHAHSARAPFHCSLSDKHLWSVSPHPWDNINLKKGSCCSRISCTFIVHRLHNIDLPCEEAGMKPLSASHHQS